MTKKIYTTIPTSWMEVETIKTQTQSKQFHVCITQTGIFLTNEDLMAEVYSTVHLETPTLSIIRSF